MQSHQHEILYGALFFIHIIFMATITKLQCIPIGFMLNTIVGILIYIKKHRYQNI